MASRHILWQSSETEVPSRPLAMKHLFQFIALCGAGVCVAQYSLQAQEPTAVIPPPSVSISDSATKITEKPIAFTPLQGAQQFYLMGQFDRAVEQYRAALHGNASDAASYAGMARAYLKLKKPDDAFAAASKAVELDPFLATAHSALGEVYIRQGKLYEAQTQFLQPFKDHQVDPRSYLGLERLYLASFNYKRAKVAIDEAYKLDPKDPDIGTAWIATRPLPERIKATEGFLTSPTGFYNRTQLAAMRHGLTVMKDEVEHPERTCRQTNPPQSGELNLVPIDVHGLMPLVGLEVDVSGQKSHLAIDSGGAEIEISNEIAEKAGIQQIARTDMEGFGDDNPPEGYIGFARSISVGNFSFANCYVRVVQEAARGSLYKRFDGEIGLALFSAFLVDINFRHAKLKLQPLPTRPTTQNADSAQMDSQDPDAVKFQDRYVSPDMNSWTQLFRFGSEIAIPARVNDSPPVLFTVSTDGPSNYLGLKIEHKWAAASGEGSSDKVQSGPPMTLIGIDGRLSGRWSGTAQIFFSDHYFAAPQERTIDFTSFSEQHGTEISGSLGLEVLHDLRITIDYRDGLIHFDNSLSVAH